jgi:surfeit locus 1 family protein
VLVVAVAALFVRLGFWQLDRLEQRRAFNARVQAGSTAPPAALDTALSASAPAFRRITAEGRYLTGGEVILFGRTLDGRPGNHVLTPLADTSGATVLVDRGWVPIELDRPRDPSTLPPPDARVTGVLVPSEDGAPPDAEGTVGAIDVDAIASALPVSSRPTVERYYVRLSSQDPPPSGELPRPVPLPALSEGPHLSYAVQWFLFAAIALVGFVVLLVRVAREGPGEAPAAEVDNP